MKFRFSFCIAIFVLLFTTTCNQAVYAQFGDNLGSHKADKALDMNAKNVNNIGAAMYKSLDVADMAAGGAIGTAAATVDVYAHFTVNQTTAAKTLTLPTPTAATAGQTVWVCNTGTADFTLYGVTVTTGKTVALTYNGAAWSVVQGGGVVVKGTTEGNGLRWNSANAKWEESATLKNDGTALTTSGHITQSGATTFSTGTGGFAINGDVIVASGKKLSLTGNTSYTSSLIAPSAGMTSTYSLTLPTALPTAVSYLNCATDGTLGWSPISSVFSMNNIAAATAANGGINNGATSQLWNWSTLTTGTGLALTANALTTGSLLSLSSTSTGQAAGSEILSISTSGSATAGIQTKGINISNTNTKGTNYGLYVQTTGGTSTANYGVYGESSGASNTTNYGVYGKASGATNNYAVYADGASYLNGALSAAGDIVPTATNTKNLGSSSYVWSNVYATTFNGNATSATKLGAATVGSATIPIYLNAGVPTALSSTVGSASTPIYLNGGVPAAITTSVGTTTNPVYLNAGVPTAITSTVGTTTNPIYLNAGVPTAISSTVGSVSTPIYLNAGVPTAISSTVGNTSTPIYLNAGVPTALSSTVGGATNPIYLNAGVPTAISSTVGSSSTPIYLNAGVPTIISSTVGSSSKPIYLNAGVPTAISSTVGDASTPIYLNAGVPTAITSVAADKGGTGITSYTTGDLLYASSSTTLSKLSAVAAGSALVSNGTGVAPSWGHAIKRALFTTVGNSTPGISVGTAITFATEAYNSIGVSYSSGTFTLAANKRYMLRAFIYGNFSGTSGDLKFRWKINSSLTGIVGCSMPVSANLYTNLQREAIAYYISTVSVPAVVEVTSVNALNNLNGDGNSFVEIEEF